MIYSGQEVGEPAGHSMGFSTDTRTSIFDYCGVPEHQKWLNNGNYDGGLLSEDQKNLRSFYSQLLNVTRSSDALRIGKFYELMVANEHQPGFNTRLYIYLRYTDNQRVLVVANFNRNEQHITVKLPDDLLNQLNISGAVEFNDLLSTTNYKVNNILDGVNLTLPATSGLLLEIV